MAKTIGDHLRLNKRRESKPRHQTFYLDDRLEHNPGLLCPECESDQIRQLHTHNVDGYDYKCSDCNLEYEINLFNNKHDEIGH